MTQQEVEQKLQEITDTITQQFDPEKLILFGSRAWGTPHEDSDFDVIVIKKVKDHFKEVRDIHRAFIGKRCPIDILLYTPEQFKYRQRRGDLFIKQVTKEGKMLYER